MSLKLGTIFGGSGTVVAGTAGAVSVVIAVAVGVVMLRGGGDADPASNAPEPQAEQVEDTPTPVEDGEPEATPEAPTTAPQAAPDTASDPAQAPDPAPLTPEPPVFDLVRVEADGSTVVAGRSSASARVTVRLDGTALQQTEADTSGAFVVLLSLSPSDSPRVLSLEAVLDGSDPVAGRETVIVSPFGMDGSGDELVASVAPQPDTDVTPPGVSDLTSGAPAVDGGIDRLPGDAPVAGLPTLAPGAAPAADTTPAAPPIQTPPADAPDTSEVAEVPEASDPAGDPAPQPQTTDVAAAPVDTPAADTATPAPPAPEIAEVVDAPAPQPRAVEPPPEPEAEPQAPAQPEAPAVLIASDEGVRVMQAPGGTPSAQTEVRLDAISYDAGGDVRLSGRGPATSGLRVLLDNEPIRLGEVGPGGDWSLDLPEVDPGTYTLRVEQLSGDGSVASRIETPFRREDPERNAASPMLVEAGASVITVQPGFTLWGIAQANFGEGVLYVSIFDENRDQIDDPDLIYPGQIFELPDLPRAQEAE